jgi:hypothetical protein
VPVGPGGGPPFYATVEEVINDWLGPDLTEQCFYPRFADLLSTRTDIGPKRAKRLAARQSIMESSANWGKWPSVRMKIGQGLIVEWLCWLDDKGVEENWLFYWKSTRDCVLAVFHIQDPTLAVLFKVTFA